MHRQRVQARAAAPCVVAIVPVAGVGLGAAAVQLPSLLRGLLGAVWIGFVYCWWWWEVGERLCTDVWGRSTVGRLRTYPSTDAAAPARRRQGAVAAVAAPRAAAVDPETARASMTTLSVGGVMVWLWGSEVRLLAACGSVKGVHAAARLSRPSRRRSIVRVHQRSQPLLGYAGY